MIRRSIHYSIRLRPVRRAEALDCLFDFHRPLRSLPGISRAFSRRGGVLGLRICEAGGTCFIERRLSQSARHLGYCIVSAPMPVAQYRAEIRYRPGAMADLLWHCSFLVDAGQAESMTRFFAGLYRRSLQPWMLPGSARLRIT